MTADRNLPPDDAPLDPNELMASIDNEHEADPDELANCKAYRAELEQEIHRLRNAEAELLAHRAYFESVFQAAQAGLLIFDADTWQIMDINDAGAIILGASQDDLFGESFRNYTSETMQEMAAEVAQGHAISNVQMDLTGAQGQPIPCIGSITKMWGQTSNLIVASFLDISELKKKEAELVAFNGKLEQMMEELKQSKQRVAQSEKLASIGQLAAGVAHEINNPVGFVTSNIGTIQEYSEIIARILDLYHQLEDADDAARPQLVSKISALREEEDLGFILDDMSNVLSESMDGVKRVAEIVQNLKSFARSDAPTLEPHDLNEGLEQMVRMTWNELKYHCTVEREFGDIPPVMCHPGQINQVLMNMIVNAGHAIGEEGGVITVGTRLVGDEVEISIGDTGSGIKPEVLSRIFDPFFTTKEVGKGTGLGLSISHGIIQDHQGRIEVDSTVGEGTTFRIYLPVPEETVPASPGVIGEVGAEDTGDALPDADELAAVFETGDEELIG